MALNSSLFAGLQQPAITFVFAVQIVLPTGNINLIDGTAAISFPVNGVATTFEGYSPVAGSISSIAPVTEAIATQAPRVQISLLPTETGGIADIGAVLAQGSPVSIWFVLINPATGGVIGTPEQLFVGMVDVVTITDTGTIRTVEVDCASAWERLLRAPEGNRLTHAFHVETWPGETGLIHNVTSTTPTPWGQDLNPTIKPSDVFGKK